MKPLLYLAITLVLAIQFQNGLCAERLVREVEVPAAAVSPDEPKAAPAVRAGGRQPWKDLKKKYNLADPVSEDYPIIFNIILFIAVSLILAVIAISVSIATMDPGRDSLIYRVTSGQKAKKDN